MRRTLCPGQLGITSFNSHTNSEVEIFVSSICREGSWYQLGDLFMVTCWWAVDPADWSFPFASKPSFSHCFPLRLEIYSASYSSLTCYRMGNSHQSLETKEYIIIRPPWLCALSDQVLPSNLVLSSSEVEWMIVLVNNFKIFGLSAPNLFRWVLHWMHCGWIWCSAYPHGKKRDGERTFLCLKAKTQACVWPWSGQLECLAWDLETKLVSYDKVWIGTVMAISGRGSFLDRMFLLRCTYASRFMTCPSCLSSLTLNQLHSFPVLQEPSASS